MCNLTRKCVIRFKKMLSIAKICHQTRKKFFNLTRKSTIERENVPSNAKYEIRREKCVIRCGNMLIIAKSVIQRENALSNTINMLSNAENVSSAIQSTIRLRVAWAWCTDDGHTVQPHISNFPP